MLFPRTAPVGLVKVMITVSSVSSAESSTIESMSIVPLVAPSSMITLPDDNAWSVPEPVAVPETE